MSLIESLAFWSGKRLRGDDYLRRFSLSEAELLAQVRGKTVALVGNARSLAQGAWGEDIDACDVVVRLNDAPMPSVVSHGRRTDWQAVAKTVSARVLRLRRPAVLLWMPTKRKRLTRTMTTFCAFFLNAPDGNRVLHDELGAPPSLGMMVIDLLSRSEARAIKLFGFDFFSSRSLSGRRDAAQVPHAFDAERDRVEALCRVDSRFELQR